MKMKTTGASSDKKVIFMLGATGTGKSRLSIDIATKISAEIINSDKIQVYKGLDIVTNKVSKGQQQGVPHYLLGTVDPEADFSSSDFCRQAISAIEWILRSETTPIVVGGSNSYIETLLEDPSFNFKSNYETCFIWLDVSLPVLYSYVSKRVDDMVNQGLVKEVQGIFVPGADYSRGIRRAIGVPEMEEYLLAEMNMNESETNKKMLLGAAIEKIKDNTCKLAENQLGKIQRLRNELGWQIHCIDATRVFEKCGSKEADDLWDALVLRPGLEIVNHFLHSELKSSAAATIFSSISNTIEQPPVHREVPS